MSLDADDRFWHGVDAAVAALQRIAKALEASAVASTLQALADDDDDDDDDRELDGCPECGRLKCHPKCGRWDSPFIHPMRTASPTAAPVAAAGAALDDAAPVAAADGPAITIRVRCRCGRTVDAADVGGVFVLAEHGQCR